MSYLVIDELYDGVEFPQEFRILAPTNIAHIRPWIYKHGTLASGEFVCQVLQGAVVLAESVIDYTDINAAFTAQFAHGYIRFDFDSLSLKIAEENVKEVYSLKFFMRNHITDINNFIGVVRIWDIKFYDTYGAGVIGGQAPNDMVEPAGIEIFQYSNI